MKRALIITAPSVVVLFIMALSVIHIWIGQSVREHIHSAQARYPGDAEEALMALLLDERNSYHDRTHVAIWTLGQIRSEKALPVLKKLYRDDPKGESCFGHHDSMLCQYEIHKAIRAIEHRKPFTHQRLKKE
jgi:hypothetical protein